MWNSLLFNRKIGCTKAPLVTFYVHCVSCNCPDVCKAFHGEWELVTSRKCMCMHLTASVTLPFSWANSWFVVYLQRTEFDICLNAHRMTGWLNSRRTVDKRMNSFRVCRSVYLHTFKWINQPDAAINYRFIACRLTLSDPTSNLVRQYDFPVWLRCRKTSDTVFVAFVRQPSEPVRRFSSCSTDFSQQIAQVILFLFLYVFLF
jgi:hypothetical protein